ncbi:MAG: carbohydrate ABC transporter permease [Candidatus Brocadiia bacterium]|jgi:multiple sugar transport system permease protein
MKPRSAVNRFLVYALLLGGSAVFLFPLVWMICTSLKPVEQTMTLPLTWLPRAFYAVVDGRRMEVTRDYRIEQPSVIVVPNEGPTAGKRALLPAAAFDRQKGLAHIQLFEDGLPVEKPIAATLIKDVAPGWWHVTEFSATHVRAHELSWDVVPESALEARIRPRWENYPNALATMGGRSLEEVEGSVERRGTGVSEDTVVSFRTFLRNTLFVCVLGVIGSVLSNALIAYGFTRVRWRGRNTLFALTLATMMVPFPVLMVPLYGVFKTLGWIGTLKPLWVPAFFGSAFNIFLMRQFFRTIPEELSEAARIDGCSEWGIFWRIILPLSWPVLAVVALFHFLWAWNDFMGPLLYLTRKHTFTLALALQNYQSQHGGVQWHLLMAASAVVVMPIIILFFFTQKTFIRGIATTGIKG